jgi:uncharacterized membrane protein
VSTAQPPSSSRFTIYVSRITHHAPRFLLALFITAYAIYFSAYTINRHNTLHSYAADLSLIDQPMWNTVLGPGGFMELTWGDHQQPRLAEHFEPILIPLALLFFVWDDVRILLIAQSVALALGALPVFWIARSQFRAEGPLWAIHNSSLPSWVALAFATAYLLFPPLQAANVADFHADPFVVTPLLFAFWYATQRRWGWMWFWAVVAMSTKETLPTLTAMLGLWLIFDFYRAKHLRSKIHACQTGSPKSKIQNGLVLILVSTLWFIIATFLIVAPLARQYFGTAGPLYFANRYVFSGELTSLGSLLQDPARWRYLWGLFAAVGFLPLLAPELLLLGLPVLIANLLSNFPGQYSGEQHYSAPLAVAFILAAIYGTRRLVGKVPLRQENEQPLQTTTVISAMLWLLCWALSYHALHGWTPLSTRLETYLLTPAAARLANFSAPIPPEAVVSASAAIHPHLAHRQIIYIFPTVQEADYLLVDVSDIPGVHPNDAHTQILNMLNTDWRVLQADQGLLLAQKLPPLTPTPRSTLPSVAGQAPLPCSPTPPLPCSFFDFVRTTALPTYATDLTFGDGRLRLLGYDVLDDPDNGVTFRFYWQTSNKLPENLRLWPLVYDDLGQLLSDPSQTPMIATVWYPPAAWQPGETIVTETLPQLLPDTFHLGLAVGPEGSFSDSRQRFPIASHLDPTIRLQAGHWVQLATFQRQGPFLICVPATPSLQPLTPVEVNFDSGIRLTGFWLNKNVLYPGETLPILLQWMADQTPKTDFTVFIHLLAPDGRRVAQSDAYPTWLTPQPTSQWPLHQSVLDSHRLDLPADLPPGVYTLQLGLYNAQTLERLRLADGSDTFILTQIQIR